VFFDSSGEFKPERGRMPWGVTLPRIGEFNPGAQAGMIKGIEPEFPFRKADDGNIKQ